MNTFYEMWHVVSFCFSRTCALGGPHQSPAVCLLWSPKSVSPPSLVHSGYSCRITPPQCPINESQHAWFGQPDFAECSGRVMARFISQVYPLASRKVTEFMGFCVGAAASWGLSLSLSCQCEQNSRAKVTSAPIFFLAKQTPSTLAPPTKHLAWVWLHRHLH